MAKNVFLAFYSIESVSGHFWSHLVTDYHSWSHLVTFVSVLVAPGNKYQHLATSWSYLATFGSQPSTTGLVIFDILVISNNTFSFLATAGHIW